MSWFVNLAIGKKIALAAVGLLAVAGATGVFASPGDIIGGSGGGGDGPPAEPVGVAAQDSIRAESSHEDGPKTETVGEVIDCAAGEDTRVKFEQKGEEFEVRGALVSLDGGVVVVAGPDGDVTATVAAGAEVKGALQPGDAVKVKGSVLADGGFLAREVEPACDDARPDAEDETGDNGRETVGDVIDCAAGEDTRVEFEQEGEEFEVRGALVSLDGGVVVVAGPDGDVTATVAAGAEVKGAFQPGDAVKVEGSVLADGGFLAREVEPACDDDEDEDHSQADAHDGDDDHGGDEGDDDHGDDEDEGQHGEGHDSGDHDDDEDDREDED